MKKILNEWRKFLTEAPLSRVYRDMMEYDCAMLSGYRDDPFDDSDCLNPSQASTPPTDEQMFKRDIGSANFARNKELLAALISLGFGVKNAKGAYIEGYKTPQAKEVLENSFFVTNLEGISEDDFFNEIINLGKTFCQESVILIPKGKKSAFVHGTNNSEWPGLDNRLKLGPLSFGREKEFMTKFRNRPMAFSIDEEMKTYKKLSRLERMVVKTIANKVLKR